MKTRIILIIGILLFSLSLVEGNEKGTSKSDYKTSSMNIFTSPDVYSLTTKLISEYTRLNPELKVQVITTSDADLTKLLKTSPAIGFISDESLHAEENLSAWNMVVGRDIIVPVMNRSNPLHDEICKNGISPVKFALFITGGTDEKGGQLSGDQQSKAEFPVHYYFVNEPSLISRLINFVNANNRNPKAIKVATEQALISAIQNDPLGIGFCKLNSITDMKNQTLSAGISLVPIDKNSNGKLDYSEAIYDNLQQFSRGVWIGRYPISLSGKIYSVSSQKPQNETELSFLNWVLTDGQQLLNSTGYSDLVLNERHSQLDKINEPAVYATAPSESFPTLKTIFLILLAIGATVFVLDILIRRKSNRVVFDSTPTLKTAFKEAELIAPKGLFFDKTHTWAFMKKDGTLKIGLDEFMQHVIGPITRIEMKKPGEMIKKGDHLFTLIQKGKQLKIYSPVTGRITESNTNLIGHSNLVNRDPFNDGWIYMVEPVNWILEMQFMDMAEKYTHWLKAEYIRLRDFFEGAVRVHVPAFVMVLQDGGVLRDGILAELGPEVWEDFQTKFIDASR